MNSQRSFNRIKSKFEYRNESVLVLQQEKFKNNSDYRNKLILQYTCAPGDSTILLCTSGLSQRS